MACRLGRRFSALIAAYALALNALLAPFGMPASATVTAWPDICASGDRSKSPIREKLPIKHQPACPLAGACSALGCAATASLGAVRQVEALFPPGSGRLIDLLHWNDDEVVPYAFHPQLARAPPIG